MDFSSVLVANRGEIALRVMRSVRRLGMHCIAIYSDADADAPHVRFADQAVYIGGSLPAESYLIGDSIIQAALSSGAGAIHPGYGFLSENAEFTRAVTASGLVFIGPPPEAVEVMGDKAVSKRAMMAADVPCIPGYHGEDQSQERLLSEAASVGYPLMVKAAAGGGGRGMRLVLEDAEVDSAIKIARSEAENAFGNGDLILERAVLRPRHVEIQVFADQYGNIIHIGERDCSVQRRHQKVVEESPCPVMTPELRERMGSAAVEAARAVDYVGAGTVEFLLDESGDFYFLEMNTRLQVEHPVTEMVTGFDLVKMQLEVALGRPLGVEQSQVSLRGHAIEVRLYAEDPSMDFLPSTGVINLWRPPEIEGVRVDAGISTGSEVSPFYDSMVAKIIAWGENRDQARQRLLRALDETALAGPANNRDFLINTLSHPRFASGEATTAFIGEVFPNGVNVVAPKKRDLAAAAVLQYILDANTAYRSSTAVPDEIRNWSSTGSLMSLMRFDTGSGEAQLVVSPIGRSQYRVKSDGQEWEVALKNIGESNCRMIIDGAVQAIIFHAAKGGRLYLCISGSGQFSFLNCRSSASGEAEVDADPIVVAPLHGLVVDVNVEQGERVEQGQPLLTLEAMKMQHLIGAPVSGIISGVSAIEGRQVSAGEMLVEIQEVEEV